MVLKGKWVVWFMMGVLILVGSLVNNFVGTGSLLLICFESKLDLKV